MKAFEFEPRNESLESHVFRTYQNLRVGLCVIGFLIPVLVWTSDWLQLGTLWPRDSISAYYHSEHSLTRDLFVANLFVIGICLILYRGYSLSENLWLDVAGFLLTWVAILPTTPEVVPALQDQTLIERIAYSHLDVAGFQITPHGACAVGFFGAIGIVAVFLANQTVEENSSLDKVYRTIGACMIVLPIAAFLLVRFIGKSFGIFLVETAGIYVFATYWGFKTYEFWGTGGEKERKLFGADQSNQ